MTTTTTTTTTTTNSSHTRFCNIKEAVLYYFARTHTTSFSPIPFFSSLLCSIISQSARRVRRRPPAVGRVATPRVVDASAAPLGMPYPQTAADRTRMTMTILVKENGKNGVSFNEVG
jgi:hypothetical protein